MLDQASWHGEPALALVGEAGRLIVVPAWGGKIVSLSSTRTGREWLWQNPHLAPRAPVYDGDFVGCFDQGGWDECFPAIRGGFHPAWPWEGTRIPDHGELWGLPWQVEVADEARIRLGVAGVRFPIAFTRELALTSTGFRLEYRAWNPTAFPFPFIWSAHPLLAIEPGMELSGIDQTMRVYGGGPFGAPFEVPRALPGPDARVAIKCFGRSPAAGRVEVSAGAERLRMTFSPREITHLGLWLNLGGWSGVPGAPPYYNLGLEPSIGAGDDLDLAVTHLGEYGTIPPRSAIEWSLDLALLP